MKEIAGTSATPGGFCHEFAWGAATAAYQIEGAWEAEGKGPSVWDQMSHWPGKVRHGQTGDIACDHYHRMEEDVGLMAEIGLGAYRFSISWPRVLPEGTGTPNQRGLDFYDRLVDRLLERGIQPWATLFHWDFPLALYHRGGWLNPESPRWFSAYARLMAQRLGDRVRHWITLNEPQMFVGLGHGTGNHAPGLQLDLPDLARLSHHVLLAHGLAVQELREHASQAVEIGWAPNVNVSGVADPSDPDLVEEARQGVFGLPEIHSFARGSAVWNDAAFLGRYPEPFVAALGHHLPRTWEEDLGVIRQPLDFCGLNIYAAWGRHLRQPGGRAAYEPAHAHPGGPVTHFDWPVTPEALYWGPRFFWERYHLPIVITENGMSGADWVHLDGRVHDPHRIDFTARYLSELRRAAADGIDVRGYFHWSLMDNFEWAEGFRQRFGLIHVDFATQRRTLKDSALWYREVIRSHGATLP